MAGEWFPLLIAIALVVVTTWAVLTVRRGVIDYVFLDFRRDEQPLEFWVTLLLLAGGALGVFYLLLS
jgi:hypothetical protein